MRTHEGQARQLNNAQFQEVIDYTWRTSSHPLRDIAILQTSYRAGLRAAEIAQITLSDLFDAHGEMKTKITLRKKTTKGSKGGVAFFTHPELREALAQYIVQERSSKTTEFDNVFISKKLTPFHPSSMSRLFGTLYRNAGFDGCTGHTGRRSLAKNLNEQNVSVYNIQKILRHSNIQTTVKHYLAVDEDTLANIMSEV